KGVLDETLHYGPYSHYWWKTNKVFNDTYFPIHVRQKTKVIFNNREFIITIVVGHSNNPYLPSYTCQSDAFYTKVSVHDPSTAISSIYTSIFNTKTHYLGPLIIEWTDHDIISQLIIDIPFFPFFFNLGQIKIFVFGIGSSSREDWNRGGSGYQSSLIHMYGKKQGLYILSIEDNICEVKVYQDSELKKAVERASPNDVGSILILINIVYNLFVMWLEQEKLNAGRSIFRAAGAYDITPWSYTESEYQFWTNSNTPDHDSAILKQFYKFGHLISIPIHMPNATHTFWNSFSHALNNNKKTLDRKRRILSIIADDFIYNELEENLG
ncbi:6728_t:CDS:2, partial [Scutellospora calospora]